MIQLINKTNILGSLGLAGLICLSAGCTTGNRAKSGNWHQMQPSFTAPVARGEARQQAEAEGWLQSSVSNLANAVKPQVKTIKSKDATNLDVMPHGGVDPNVYVLAGNLSASRQQWPQALEHFQQALKLDSGNLAAICGCAAVSTEQGKFAEAIEFYKMGVKAADEAEALELASEISYCYLQLEQPEKAIVILESLVNDVPGNTMFRKQLAYAFTKNGNVESALKHLNAIMPPAEALMNLGAIQAELGMMDLARTSFEEAFAQDNQLTHALDRAKQLGSTMAAAHVAAQNAGQAEMQDYLKPVQGMGYRSQGSTATINYEQPADGLTRQTNVQATDLQHYRVSEFNAAQEEADAKFREKIQLLREKIAAETSKSPRAFFRPTTEKSRALARFSAGTKDSSKTKTATLPESINSLLR